MTTPPQPALSKAEADAMCPKWSKFTRHRCMPMGHGFTLVELLVVVSVIALLLALLMPSFRKARAIAIRVKCASNDHQLFLGMHAYSVESKDDTPIGYVSNNVKQGNYYLAHNEGPTCMLGVLWNSKHITVPDLYYCPGIDKGDYSHYRKAFTSNGLSWNIPGDDAVRSTVFSRPAVQWDWSNYLVIKPQATDETDHFPKLDDFSKKAIISCDPYGWTGPHLDGLNATRGDGSVTYVPYSASYTYASGDDRRSRTNEVEYRETVQGIIKAGRGSQNNIAVDKLYKIMDMQ
jgi:prepilin-type N-terminal cleavage/methylation domain-containing protein